jgi:hypothetical protein
MPDQYILPHGQTPIRLDDAALGPVNEAGHPVGWVVDARDEAGRPTKIAGTMPVSKGVIASMG